MSAMHCGERVYWRAQSLSLRLERGQHCGRAVIESLSFFSSGGEKFFIFVRSSQPVSFHRMSKDPASMMILLLCACPLQTAVIVH